MFFIILLGSLMTRWERPVNEVLNLRSRQMLHGNDRVDEIVVPPVLLLDHAFQLRLLVVLEAGRWGGSCEDRNGRVVSRIR